MNAEQKDLLMRIGAALIPVQSTDPHPPALGEGQGLHVQLPF